MMLLLAAEWLRFRRRRANLAVILLTLALLGMSAWFAGSGAADHRAYERERIAAWDAHLAATRASAAASAGEESAAAARAAYEFGRGKAPPALRPAPGGLVLAVQQFQRQPYDVRVSLDSRHLDPRRSAPLDNPLLDSFGIPDFAAACAILLPLAVIALCYGLVLEAREQGIWRQLGMQMSAPLGLLGAGLAIRWAALTAAGLLASCLAFALDPGSDARVLGTWALALALYVFVWILIAGLFNTARISSATSALGMLALVLVLNVLLPACLQAYAARCAPLPAREGTVLAIRAIQQRADDDMDALLAHWYARHPAQRPASIQEHTWPVSYLPKTVWQDGRIHALMHEFDRTRTRQAELLAPWLWMSPGLALTRVGDRLAGSDPGQIESYGLAVERFEQRWRAALGPAVMSYRGLQRELLAALPAFSAPLTQAPSGFGGIAAGLALAAAALAAALLARAPVLRRP